MAPSIWQILLILLVVLLLFGTKRLRNIGSDLGTAIKGFRSSMKEPKDADNKPDRLGQDADPDRVVPRERDRSDVER